MRKYIVYKHTSPLYYNINKGKQLRQISKSNKTTK